MTGVCQGVMKKLNKVTKNKILGMPNFFVYESKKKRIISFVKGDVKCGRKNIKEG